MYTRQQVRGGEESITTEEVCPSSSISKSWVSRFGILHTDVSLGWLMDARDGDLVGSSAFAPPASERILPKADQCH